MCTLQLANNKGADQDTLMRRLFGAFVIRIQQNRVFSRRDPFLAGCLAGVWVGGSKYKIQYLKYILFPFQNRMKSYKLRLAALILLQKRFVIIFSKSKIKRFTPFPKLCGMREIGRVCFCWQRNLMIQIAMAI